MKNPPSIYDADVIRQHIDKEESWKGRIGKYTVTITRSIATSSYYAWVTRVKNTQVVGVKLTLPDALLDLARMFDAHRRVDLAKKRRLALPAL
jgi:hypothetical protein